MIILQIIISILVIFIAFYSFYGIFSLFKTLIHVSRKKYDELEKKAIFDSLAYGMLILMAIHLIQLILSVFLKKYYPNNLYIAVISSGAPKGNIIGNSPLHIESIFFDIVLVNIIYTINKFKYNLITKKQFLTPIVIIFIIIFLSICPIIYNYYIN